VADGYKVFGTTRKAPSAALEAKGVTSIKFSFGDAASAKAALTTSGAKLVFFLTDFFNVAGSKRSVEAMHGNVIIDACVNVGGIEHVVFSSVAHCDKCPDAVEHFKSKLEVEQHLYASGLPFSILRPVAFFENFDDPANYNPLKEGSVKSLCPMARRPQGEAGRLCRHRRGHGCDVQGAWGMARKDARLRVV
jgi:uncharacterized protein YbjT (DUF2867 family)